MKTEENELNDAVEIDLMELVKALWQRAYIIIITAFLLGALFFVHAAYLTAPVFQADALMYVNNSSLAFASGKLSISPSELDAAQSLVGTYSIIARSRTTLNEVIARAELDYTYQQLSSMVSVSPINDTEIFKISVQSTDPEEAEYIANTIADVLPETIAEIVDGSSVRVVDYAVIPASKISPSITKNTAMGMLLGAILSSGVIVLLVIFNDVIHGKENLLQNYDIPVLTVVPHLQDCPPETKERK